MAVIVDDVRASSETTRAGRERRRSTPPSRPFGAGLRAGTAAGALRAAGPFRAVHLLVRGTGGGTHAAALDPERRAHPLRRFPAHLRRLPVRAHAGEEVSGGHRALPGRPRRADLGAAPALDAAEDRPAARGRRRGTGAD